MATIEGTGIKTPSKESSKKATAFLGNFQKKADEKFIKTYESKQDGNIQNSDFETDRYNKLKKKYGDQFSSDASTNFFSPGGGAYDSRNNVETASASGDFSGLVSDSDTKVASNAYSDASGDYNKYLKENYGFDTDSRTYKNMGGQIKRILKDSYNDDAIKFREGTQINQAPTKEKTIGERVADFTGNVVNTLTGTQSAVAQTKESGKGLFGGSVPEGTYSQFSPTTKTQYQSNREENRPNQNNSVAEAGAGIKFGSVNLNAAKGVESPTATKTPSEDTSFSSYVRGGGVGQQRGDTGSGDTSFSSYVRGAGEGQERGNTRLAEARQIAKRNPNVSINKSTGKAEATNDSGRAKAQAMAVNRKLSGKSISQTKAANNAAMRKSAAERHSTFKKTGKSTVGARRAAAKKANQAAAKKRHSAFKKRRAAKRKKKSKKK